VADSFARVIKFSLTEWQNLVTLGAGKWGPHIYRG
jgi:hypothetical protein